jgi:hypothetical protein
MIQIDPSYKRQTDEVFQTVAQPQPPLVSVPLAALRQLLQWQDQRAGALALVVRKQVVVARKQAEEVARMNKATAQAQDCMAPDCSKRYQAILALMAAQV